LINQDNRILKVNATRQRAQRPDVTTQFRDATNEMRESACWLSEKSSVV